ncbi:MAG: L,D-transpeptidase family protein [Elusimicrobia bacterium]|nr:L,D-transpeptidase family protein [Elusimicrobiota bacterium]
MKPWRLVPLLLIGACKSAPMPERACRAVIGETTLRCAVGRSGVRADKREGDGATPAGEFSLRKVYYRPDRVAREDLATALPVEAIMPDDGWCDDPAAPEYNRPVKLPFKPSHEDLWLKSAVYDIVVVIGYNDEPPIPGKGSAIFLHVAHDDYRPTAGCVALSRRDLLQVLGRLRPGAKVRIETDGTVRFL